MSTSVAVAGDAKPSSADRDADRVSRRTCPIDRAAVPRVAGRQLTRHQAGPASVTEQRVTIRPLRSPTPSASLLMLGNQARGFGSEPHLGLGGWGLTTAGSCSLIVLEAKSPRSGCLQGHKPSEGPWGHSCLASPSFWWPPAFLGEWLLPTSVCPHLPVAPSVPRKDA